eukprot:g3546.t1
MWTCGHGVLEVDEQGFIWAKQGICVSACEVTIAVNACLFTSRYGRYPMDWKFTAESPKVLEEGEEEVKQKQNKTEVSSNTTKVETVPGKIQLIEAIEPISSLPLEDLEDQSDRGKIPRDPALEDREDSISLPTDLSIHITEDNGTDPQLLISSPSENTPTLITPVQSPQAKEGKVIVASSVSPVPHMEDDMRRPAGKTRRKRQSVVVFDPMPPLMAVDDAPQLDELPVPSPSPRVHSTLIEAPRSAPQVTSFSQEGEIYLSPWMPCLQLCNIPSFEENRRERFIVCRSKLTGIALPSSFCTASNEASFEECSSIEKESRSCQGKYIIKYSSWSDCSQSCTLNQQGNRTRDYECFERLEDNSLVSVLKSNCSPPDASARRLTCTPRPCDLLLFRTSEWNDCNCDTKTQNRSLTCVKIENSTSTSITTNTSLELCKSRGLFQPRSTRNCTCVPQSNARGRLLLQDHDPCEGITCSGHGNCLNGSCNCEEGFDGPSCDQPQQIRAPGSSCSALDGPECCESGLYDSFFNCCSIGSSLDRNGDCCEGKVDICGQCNGSAVFVDALGKCCQVMTNIQKRWFSNTFFLLKTTLDAAGLCCESGNVDECGVCDGFGASCNFKIAFAIQQNVSSLCVQDLVSQTLPLAPEVFDLEIKHTFEEGSLHVFVPGASMSLGRGAQLVEKLIQEKLPDFYSTSCGSNVQSLDHVGRESVAGNDYCEIGETIFIPSTTFTGFFQDNISWRGAGDCQFVIATCPVQGIENSVGEVNKPCSNRGICAFAGRAQCHCFRGYQGDSCDICEPGYFPYNGTCLRSTSASSNVTVSEDTAQNSESTESEEEGGKKRRRFVLIVGIIIPALILLILSVFFVTYLSYHSRDGAFIRNDNTSNQGTGYYSRFTGHTPSHTGGLLDGQLNASSSSGLSGGLSFKTEPISVPPLNRKSPFPFDSKHMSNHDASPSKGERPNPFLPSSSANPSTLFPIEAFRNKTIDIRGHMKETRRMPSPDDNQLMTIQERVPVHFEIEQFQRQTASLGSLDNFELICFTPTTVTEETEKTRRHSSEGNKVTSMAHIHGSIASLGEYVGDEDIAENEISVEAPFVLSADSNTECTNGFEFALPLSQKKEEKSSDNNHKGSILNLLLKRSNSDRRPSGLLSRGIEIPDASNSAQWRDPDHHQETPRPMQSTTTSGELQQGENCVIVIPLEDQESIHQFP